MAKRGGRRLRSVPVGVDADADADADDAEGFTFGAAAREEDAADVYADDEEDDEMYVTSHRGWARFVHSGPRPVADGEGIRARSKRGRIGASWWSRRFLEVIESLQLGGRLDRGRTYARKGQVLDLTVHDGLVKARVQGSRARPYTVTIEVRRISAADWDKAVGALAARAGFAARLLAGEMPPDIEEAFTACRLSLFPEKRADLVTHCSCPDLVNPCKHIAAVLYLLAERFDDDPFLLFEWRGRGRKALLDSLRAQRGVQRSRAASAAQQPGIAAPPLDSFLTRFWEGGESAVTDSRPLAALVPDAVLRSATEGADPVAVDALAPLYNRFTKAIATRT